MKKILLTLALMATMSATAENSAKLIQVGKYPQGIVSITPASIGDTIAFAVCLSVDRAYDEFHIAVESTSEHIEPVDFLPGSWLTDDVYLTENGEPTTVDPYWESGECWCRCRILEVGYEPDGTCYGSVKWQERQRNEMAILRVVIKEGFQSGKINLVGYFASGPDSREYIDCICGIEDYESESYIIVQPDTGDVNADGVVTIADVTALIDKLM
jgi:hypothetical protein